MKSTFGLRFLKFFTSKILPPTWWVVGWKNFKIPKIGSLCQTGTCIVFACRRNCNFDILPKYMKVVTILACPFLLGPVVVNLFAALQCFRGIDAENLTKLKTLVASLKLGEIVFESVPQLLLNSFSLFFRCSNSGNDETYLASVYSTISFVKGFSIITSLFGVTFTNCSRAQVIGQGPNWRIPTGFTGVKIGIF